MLTPCVAMIGFVSPWMAWGTVAAVGLPVLAHLLSKTRYREAVFPAARLVQQAISATSRIETPRHRLLMLLRFLVLMLLVLAFMRPQWTPDAKAIDEQQGIALVLLIDASASMQRSADGATLYDRAAQQAQRLLDQLDPTRDVAAVIRVDHAPASLLPEPTAQLSLLSERLSATDPGYTHTNWPAAIALAQRLTRDEQRTLRVITLSDQQGEQPDAALDHIRINGPTDNTAVRLVDVRPYPPIAGRPITAETELTHFGDQPRTVQLRASLRDTTQTQSLILQPGESRRIVLTFEPPAEGQATLRVSINAGDAIAADDSAGISMKVRDGWRARVLYDRPETKSLAEQFATMLRPGEVEGLALPTVQIDTLDNALQRLNQADPAELRTVVTISTRQLDPATQQAVISYVERGGGVVGLTVYIPATNKPPMIAGAIDFSLEPLRVFEGPARAGLAALTWPYASPWPLGGGGVHLLQSADGTPLVHETTIGRGRRIALASHFSLAQGGLLAEPAFVVLFNELCRYASPGPAVPAPAKPGDPIPTRLLDAAQTVVAEGADVDAKVFTAPGPYGGMDESGFVTELMFAELDPDESDTRTPSTWLSATASSNTAAAESNSSTAIAASLRDNPIELWPYFVLGVLGLVATESLLLRRFAGPRPMSAQGGAA